MACQLVKQSLYKTQVVSPGPEMTLGTIKKDMGLRPSAQRVYNLAQASTGEACTPLLLLERMTSEAGRVPIVMKGRVPPI